MAFGWLLYVCVVCVVGCLLFVVRLGALFVSVFLFVVRYVLVVDCRLMCGVHFALVCFVVGFRWWLFVVFGAWVLCLVVAFGCCCLLRVGRCSSCFVCCL